MIHVFHTSFVAKIEKIVQKKPGHDDQISKNKLYDNIAIQKSMTSFVTVHEKTKHNALDNKSIYKPR